MDEFIAKADRVFSIAMFTDYEATVLPHRRSS